MRLLHPLLSVILFYHFRIRIPEYGYQNTDTRTRIPEIEDNSIFEETESWKIILYLEKLNLGDNLIFGETEPGS